MKSHTLIRHLAVLATLLTAVPDVAQARNFRPSIMPNGTAASCSACHVRASGGGDDAQKFDWESRHLHRLQVSAYQRGRDRCTAGEIKVELWSKIFDLLSERGGTDML